MGETRKSRRFLRERAKEGATDGQKRKAGRLSPAFVLHLGASS
jgi:hypothetical protein